MFKFFENIFSFNFNLNFNKKENNYKVELQNEWNELKKNELNSIKDFIKRAVEVEANTTNNYGEKGKLGYLESVLPLNEAKKVFLFFEKLHSLCENKKIKKDFIQNLIGNEFSNILSNNVSTMISKVYKKCIYKNNFNDYEKLIKFYNF